jgi:hypothetical protein
MSVPESYKELEGLMEDLYEENESLRARAEAAESILKGEQAIDGAFGRTRLWGALNTVLDATPTEDELDQIMRLLNANSKGIDAARAAGEGE